MKNVFEKLISENQTGFIKGRYIGENIRLIYDLLNYTDTHDIPVMLFFIDFQKAYDTVSWEFMFKVLNFFNVGESFQKWISVFYKNINICIVQNNILSD